MTVHGYTRVSTNEQGSSGLGLEAQTVAITRSLPTGEIVAEVASGKSLAAMLFRHSVRRKIVRFGRNAAHAAGTIAPASTVFQG